MLVNLFSTEMVNHSDEVNKELDKRFISKDKFASDIESLVHESKLSYIDAIVEYCEENNIEIETVKKLVSKPLREKIRFEATELNFLKKTTRAKLPL